MKGVLAAVAVVDRLQLCLAGKGCLLLAVQLGALVRYLAALEIQFFLFPNKCPVISCPPLLQLLPSAGHAQRAQRVLGRDVRRGCRLRGVGTPTLAGKQGGRAREVYSAQLTAVCEGTAGAQQLALELGRR